jgi:hypothetical protein
MRFLFATAAVLIAATLTPAATAGGTDWQWQYQKWMPKHWQNLAACESGSNPPNWRHNSGTYEGAFGFYHGSWDSFRPAWYPSSASDATPWQQWRVALRIAARYGIASPWGCWRGSQHAWVRNGLPERGVYR